MKKQTVVALALLLLIPVVFLLEGRLSSLINPDSAAGHPNYARNYHYLSQMRTLAFWGMVAVVWALWLAVCFLVIRSKGRSSWWLFLAALGPFGFAILAMLNDRAPAETDRYARFVRNLNKFVRAGYEVCLFGIIWQLGFEAMVFKSNLMIQHEAATTGVPVARIMEIRNASSGMWAFGEGMEEMYFMVLLYLIWPVVFNIGARCWPSAREKVSGPVRS